MMVEIPKKFHVLFEVKWENKLIENIKKKNFPVDVKLLTPPSSKIIY